MIYQKIILLSCISFSLLVTGCDTSSGASNITSSNIPDSPNSDNDLSEAGNTNPDTDNNTNEDAINDIPSNNAGDDSNTDTNNPNNTDVNPDSDSPTNQDPGNSGDNSDLNEPNITTLPKIHQNGRYWENELGQQVNLRGTNIGNWLQLEFWMMNQPMYLDNTVINDQCTLENALTERFGHSEKERLMDVYRDSWITDRDWDHMAAMGVNVVRIPFMYSLIEDENNPYTLRADAWQYLDYAINEAEKRGMYAILDLHGAVGSQGWEHHSGCAGKNELWDSESFRDRTKWLWDMIASRYKDRSSVAGYGLLNEPWGTDGTTLADFSAELYHVIRAKDPEHMIILPGHSSEGIDAYGHPSSRSMNHNIAFEMHFYPGFWGWRDNEDPTLVHSDWLHCDIDGTGEVCDWQQKLEALQTPLLVGEFQPWTNQGQYAGEMTRKTFDIYNALGWAATSWAYKTTTFAGAKTSAEDNWGWGMVSNAEQSGAYDGINLLSASINDIENYFKGFATQSLVRNSDIEQWMNYQSQTGERIEAEHFSQHSGARMEVTSDTDGGFNVSYLDEGDWMQYQVAVSDEGWHILQYRAATLNGAKISFTVDQEQPTNTDFYATNGWQDWQTTSVRVYLKAGLQDITLLMQSSGLNLNWFTLTLDVNQDVQVTDNTSGDDNKADNTDGSDTDTGNTNGDNSDIENGNDSGSNDNTNNSDTITQQPLTALPAPHSILFVGNSFTFMGPIPTLVNELAQYAGFTDLNIQYRAVSGSSLSKHRADTSLEGAPQLVNQGWDSLVIQEQSSRPTDWETANPSQFYEDAAWFFDLAKQANQNTDVVLYETWAYRYDHGVYSERFQNTDDFQAQLRYHYTYAAQQYIPQNSQHFNANKPARIAAVGDAWQQQLQLHGEAPRLHSDIQGDHHGGIHGQYLSALILYSTLFNRRPENLPALLGISTDMAIRLQETAANITDQTYTGTWGQQANALEVGSEFLIDIGELSEPSWHGLTQRSGETLKELASTQGENSSIHVTSWGFRGNQTGGALNTNMKWPENVSRDSFYVGSFDNHEDALKKQANIILRGLPAGEYKIEIFGSRDGNDNGLGRVARFQIGDEFVDQDTSDNNSDVSTFNVSPDQYGEIIIKVKVSPDSLSRFAYVNAVKVTYLAKQAP